MSCFRALALAAALTAPSVAAAQPISLPANLQSNTRELWRAVMTGVYGPYDSKRKCWIGRKDTAAYCMRPHKLDKVSDGGVEKLYLAVAGAATDAETCHACTGNMGLLMFEQRAGQLFLVAQNGLYNEIGAWGEAPPEESFQVAQIAANLHAWVIETGYTAQGISCGGKEIFAPKGPDVISLGSIPTFLDNCGAVADGEDCKSYAFDLSFRPAAGLFYDAVVQASKDSDTPPAGTRFDIPFDAATGKYAPPKALEDMLEM